MWTWDVQAEVLLENTALRALLQAPCLYPVLQ
jgi:hypothetical protein